LLARIKAKREYTLAGASRFLAGAYLLIPEILEQEDESAQQRAEKIRMVMRRAERQWCFG
jgi:hypothetical protein